MYFGRMLCAAVVASLAASFAQGPPLSDAPVTTFGVTVVDGFGLRGDIYLLPDGTDALPDFSKLRPVGSIYTRQLNIQPREFQAGFPGVTNVFEWFAIDYNGYFYVRDPGKYRFIVASDDGAKLYIDDKRVIDNDGIHSLRTEEGTVNLKGGIHTMRLSYFQGPRTHLALVLGVARPGEEWRLFSTNDFQPPRDPKDWKYGDPDKLPPLSNDKHKK
ncbi:MAG: PA14 domain-containing protein [Candidatus Solibacter sp.]